MVSLPRDLLDCSSTIGCSGSYFGTTSSVERVGKTMGFGSVCYLFAGNLFLTCLPVFVSVLIRFSLFLLIYFYVQQMMVVFLFVCSECRAFSCCTQKVPGKMWLQLELDCSGGLPDCLYSIGFSAEITLASWASVTWSGVRQGTFRFP